MAIVWQKSAPVGVGIAGEGLASNTEKGCHMPDADPTSLRLPAAKQPAAVPLASIKAYRRTGGAVVTIERQGRSPRRHRVSLRRYAALRGWTITRAARRWRTSGAWLRGSIAVSLWPPAHEPPRLCPTVSPRAWG